MRSFVKIKSLRNGEITLSFTDLNHAIVANFNVANMSCNAIRENKILAEISGLTEIKLFTSILNLTEHGFLIAKKNQNAEK